MGVQLREDWPLWLAQLCAGWAEQDQLLMTRLQLLAVSWWCRGGQRARSDPVSGHWNQLQFTIPRWVLRSCFFRIYHSSVLYWGSPLMIYQYKKNIKVNGLVELWQIYTIVNTFMPYILYSISLGQCHNIITCTMIPRVSSAVRCF